MSRQSLLVAAACIVSFGLCAPAVAQRLSGPYVSLGAGADFQQDQTIEPVNEFSVTKRAYQFDAGFAGDGALGYALGNGFRVEASGDYARNELSGVRFANGRKGSAVGADLQYGGFGSLVYDIPLGLPVTPYLGAGAGYQEIELDRVGSGRLGAHLDPTRRITHGAFAYQAIAGLSYVVPFVTGLSLTLEYHMVGVQSPAPYYRGAFPGNNRIFLGGVEQFDEGTLHNTFNHEIFLGVRYTFGRPPAPSPVAAGTTPPVMPPEIPAARTYVVFFDWDRADLTARARQIVAQAAAAARATQSVRLDVNGYTDLSGTAAYNQRLSVRRARTVEAELVRDGVSQGEISVHGYGETNPLVATAQGVREPQNRRVEVVFH